MDQRKLWVIAGALYVVAAVGAVALNASGPNEIAGRRVAAVEQPTATATSAVVHPDAIGRADDDAVPVTDAEASSPVFSGPAPEVACTTEEQDAIAAAAIRARDDVLAQIDDVKEQRLSELGLLEIGGEVPDFVETELDSIDNAGQASLDEVDRKVAEAGAVCRAGDDPRTVLDSL